MRKSRFTEEQIIAVLAEQQGLAATGTHPWAHALSRDRRSRQSGLGDSQVFALV